MRLLARKKTPTEELKQAAIEAAISALEDHQGRPKGRPALSGVRAVGTGVVLFTAARAAFKRRRFLGEQLPSEEDEETTEGREEREPDEDGGERKPRGRGAHDATEPERSKPAGSQPKRKPVRRAARDEGSQPSLELPQQRWPRLSANKR